MFTGIVEEVGEVSAVRCGGLSIAASRVVDDLRLGCSINVNGVCLTVTAMDDSTFDVDVVPETLSRTNLGLLSLGDSVNLERPIPTTGRLDGHIVQGHVDGTGTVGSVEEERESLLVRVEAQKKLLRYVVEKGFVAVDGISLTVVDCDQDGFVFMVIPFTKANTNLGLLRFGDVMNIEIDILAKYVEKLLKV